MPKNGFRNNAFAIVVDVLWFLVGALALVVFFRNGDKSIGDYSVLLLGLLFIFFAIGKSTIVKHYDPYLKDIILRSSLIDSMAINSLLPFSNKTIVGFRSNRLAIFYLIPVLMPKRYRKRNKVLASIFKDFDFASKVTLFEKIVAGAITGVIMAYFVLAVIYIYQLIAS